VVVSLDAIMVKVETMSDYEPISIPFVVSKLIGFPAPVSIARSIEITAFGP
jgi:hypothetical protein